MGNEPTIGGQQALIAVLRTHAKYAKHMHMMQLELNIQHVLANMHRVLHQAPYECSNLWHNQREAPRATMDRIKMFLEF
jgi:hypothetical protein